MFFKPSYNQKNKEWGERRGWREKKKLSGLPDTVQHFSSFRNPQQLVVCRDIMEVCSLLIGKE